MGEVIEFVLHEEFLFGKGGAYESVLEVVHDAKELAF